LVIDNNNVQHQFCFSASINRGGKTKKVNDQQEMSL
jgi:hypothetical protein